MTAVGARLRPRRLQGDSARLALAVLCVAFVLASGSWATVENAVLLRWTPQRAESGTALIVDWLTVVIPLAAAFIIIATQRRHPVGWLLLSYVVLFTASAVTGDIAALGLLHGPGNGWPGVWVAVTQGLERLSFGSMFLLALLFPSGRLPSPGWRPLARFMVAFFLLWFAFRIVAPGPSNEDPFAGVQNPLGIAFFSGHAVQFLFLPIAVLLAGACLVALIGRVRRSRGDERQQLKWFGVAALSIPAFLLAILVASAFGPPAENAVGNIGGVAVDVTIPLAVVVAITRYRLYDLDLLVNRTVVYGGVCVVLVATYLAVVFVADRLVVGAGWTSPWVVAVATLAAAVGAAPARRRIQQLADRTFGRRRWAARRRIENLAVRARREPVSPIDLQQAMAQTCGDATAWLAYWLRDRDIFADGDGARVELPATDPAISVLRIAGADGAPLAALVHDAVVGRNARLLSGVVEAAGLLLENARLQAEANARVVEVQESRRRIVQAADDERRRIERDLHDGVQQRLVAMALQLKLAARRRAAVGPAELEAIVGQVQATIDEVRELARGVHPSVLADGLGPALEAVAARLPIDADIDVAPAPLSELAELTCYYVACEAITNAMKHARAQHLWISSSARDGLFSLGVRDDGDGGAVLTPGSGLAGLGDRASAVAGRLLIDSRRGAGTAVTVVVPCGR